MLGILSGVGPYASNFFIKRMLEITDAEKEWDQFPFISYCNTQIPSRTKALLYGEKSPKDGMIESINLLEKTGATMVAVPCNSAHGWYNEVEEKISIPWINMIDEVSKKLSDNSNPTLVVSAYVPTAMRLYEKHLENIFYPKKRDRKRIFEIIEKIKLGRVGGLRDELYLILNKYDVVNVIIACTELSMLFDKDEMLFGKFKLYDSTNIYATKCVECFSWNTK